MTAQPLEDARHRMAQSLLASGYSVEQAAERSGLSRRQVQDLATPTAHPADFLTELRQFAKTLPGRPPEVVAEKFITHLTANQPPQAVLPTLRVALTLILNTEWMQTAVGPAPAPVSARPRSYVAPSRKTEIVKDLVQARLDCRVVIDGESLRFAECTRDQVLALYDKTKDAAAALMAHAVWLSSVSESMLMHRVATVGELPAEPRAALMEAKPE